MVTQPDRELYAYRLSPMQQGMLFHTLYTPGSDLYIEQLSCELVNCDIGAFRRAWDTVIERHEVFRSSVVWEGLDAPLQVVQQQVEAPWIEEDWRGFESTERAARLQGWLEEDRRNPFDLVRAPLMRFALFRTGETSYCFVWTQHHLLIDGWSHSLIIREVLAFYRDPNYRTPRPRPYRDFISWLERQDTEKAEAFWRAHLGDISQPASLGLKDEVGPPKLCERTRFLGADLTAGVKRVAKELHVTMHTLVQAAFGLALSRHSDSFDVVFGSTVSGRPPALEGAEHIIGLLINTVPARLKVAPGAKLSDWLSLLQREQADREANSSIPLPQIQGVTSAGSAKPLFESLLVFENYPSLESLPGLPEQNDRRPPFSVQNVRGTYRSNYPIAIVVGASGEGLVLRSTFDVARFSDPTLPERLAGHFEIVLRSMIRNPDQTVGSLMLLTEEEEVEQRGWNETEREYSRVGLAELFERVVETHGKRPALVRGEERWSYEALNEQANALAHRLREAGVVRESKVGISVRGGAEAVLAMLGVIKAGGAYVPLLPEEPAERRERMASQAGVGWLIREERGWDLPGMQTILLEETGTQGKKENLNLELDGEQLAYVIHTSGSTGEPKGIGVPQGAVARLVLNTDYVELKSGDRVAQVSNYGFDAMTFEVWGPLLTGGCIVVTPREVSLTPWRMAEHLKRERIDVVFLTTALFNQIVAEEPNAFETVGTLLVGGEAATPSRFREALENGAPGRLLHVYGPTESTTFASWYEIQEVGKNDTSIPIGKPLANTTAWVLGPEMQLRPVGVVGELYLGGEGLARGYENQAAMTAERFVPDPFAARAGSRLYRTGDRVKWRGDGTLEYLGRLDNQVKLRGFRIELGEIEAALRGHEAVAEAAVMLRTEPKRLVGYVTLRPEAEVTAADMIGFLKLRLPEYMIPSSIGIISQFPLNRNGKIDRSLLPELIEEAPGQSLSSGSTDAIEEIVLGFFSEVLGLPAVGPHDNFFELRGHSLQAMQLIARVRDAFSVEVSLQSFFGDATPSGLSSSVRVARQQARVAAPPIEPRQDRQPLLSFAQERLWFLNQFEPESPFYNTATVLRIDGVLDVTALSCAFQEIVERHEVLRMIVSDAGGAPIPIFQSGVAPALEQIDLTKLAPIEREAEARRLAAQEAQRPFHLAKGPLIRYKLLKLSEQQHVLLVTMHHIVSDGWSMGVLAQEMTELYEAFRQGRPVDLAPLRIQYADFALWQRTWLSEDVLARQLNYWKGRLSGAPPLVALPADRSRPPRQSYRGGTVRFTIDEQVAGGLYRLSRQEGATLYMTLLAGFSTLLCRYADQLDLVIGSPIANRTRSEIEPLIGFFVNTLALRIDLSGDPDFLELLARVRAGALEAYDNQDLPFERLVEEMRPERDESRNPLFQVMFTLQNAAAPLQFAPGLAATPIQPDQPSALFDLSLDIWETKGSLTGVFEYSSDLFDRETVERMAESYKLLLRSIMANPSSPIRELQMVSASERSRVLEFGEGGKLQFPQSTLAELVERQAGTASDKTAIVHGRRILTYRELNARANRIANWLRRKGAVPNSFAAILLPRGVDYATALLGILKSGAAFLPIDPEYPRDRVRHMLSDSGVRLIVSQSDVVESGDFLSLCQRGEVLLLDQHDLSGEHDEDLPPVNVPDDTAYILYTSGSTGLPKGAMVRHDGAISHIFAEARELGLSEATVFLQSAPCSSDISVWQYLAPWVLGGSVVVADSEVVCTPSALLEMIRAEGVTLIELVPVVLQELVHHASSLSREGRALSALQCAMVTGEAGSVALVNRWFQAYPQVPLVNAYGPTEAADDVCQAKFAAPLAPELPSLPIGRPIPNLSLYVLDRSRQLVPTGVPGEICVAGVGVGKGYWKQAELTREKFVPNPHPGAGKVLYRTGDLGRWRSDGTLEFIGRIDEQVKLRGFRIELGEIEHVLAQHSSLREAVVANFAHENGNRLVAYVVPKTEAFSLEQQQLKLWESLHDESYKDTSGEDPAFNTIGWDSNYTNRPLTDAEMREYIGHNVSRILEHEPKRVLEIGCGTGLLAYPLCGPCEQYVGTDLSAVAVRRLSEDARSAGLTNAEFRVQLAHDFQGLPRDFDAIVMSSVIQYFPSAGYLSRVIENALGHLREDGIIFIGDVRSLPLLRCFHLSVQLFKADSDLGADEVFKRTEAQLRREQELALDPEFFRALIERDPRIQRIEIVPKRGRLDNELTRFRYDVILHTRRRPALDVDWQDFHDIGQIRTALSKGASSFGVRRIPNSRLAHDLAAASLLGKTPAVRTVGDLRRAAELQPVRGLHPEDLIELSSSSGYHLRLSQWESRTDGAFDAVFFKNGTGQEPRFFDTVSELPRSSVSNTPLREMLQLSLGPRLREFLGERLPDYMIPSQYVVLDSLPLSPAGKVDRSVLPTPEPPSTGERYVAPRNPVEQSLVRIWAEVLAIPEESIGVNDDFFALNGHSLKATQVVSRIQRDLGVEVPLRAVFSHPTIAGLSTQLPSGGGRGRRPIPRAPEEESYPLSHGQSRLWMLSQTSGASVAYHMPTVLRLRGQLDIAALEQALTAVSARHEILRTALVEVDGEPRQKILSGVPVFVEKVVAASDEEARRIVQDDLARTIDLRSGAPFRAVLVELPEQQHVLVLTFHHAAFDGWSERIFACDVMEAYEVARHGGKCRLTPLPIAYKDYVCWQKRFLESSAGSQLRDYWAGKLAPLPDVLNLPLDHPRPSEKTYAGDAVSLQIAPEQVAVLRRFANESQASLYSALMALAGALLNCYTGQSDLVLGCPVAGRSHPDLEDQIGFYVNTLPVRVRVTDSDSFASLLYRTAATVSEALDHQDYPIDCLIRDLQLTRHPGRLPLIEAIVNFQTKDADAVSIPGLAVEAFEFELQTSQFDLAFYFSEDGDHLSLDVRYCRDLFDRPTIERLAGRFESLLKAALESPRLPIEELDIDEIAAPTAVTPCGGSLLSHHQERLWFIDQFESGNVYAAQPVYHNVPLILEFRGELEAPILERSVNQVIAVNPELRQRILIVDGKPQKKEVPESAVMLQIIPWQGGSRAEALCTIIDFAQQPLPLDQSAGMRMGLLKVAPLDVLIVLTIHHAFVDPASVRLIARSIIDAYNGQTLPAPRLCYSDYVLQQRAIDANLLEQLAFYWTRRLRGRLEPLNLAEDRPRPAVHTYTSATHGIELSLELSKSVEDLSQRSSTDASTVLLAAFKALLFLLIRQENITVGFMHPNRRADLEDVVGPIANLLTLCTRVSGEASFESLLDLVKRCFSGAIAHRDMPFDRLVQIVRPGIDMSRTALFDVLFRYDDCPDDSVLRGNVAVEPIETGLGYGKYDFQFCVSKRSGRFAVTNVYNADLYDPETASRLLRQFAILLESVTADPVLKLGTISLVSAEDHVLELDTWNQTAAQWPTHAAVHQIFEEQAKRNPLKIALTLGNAGVTYEELNRRSNRLAHYLLARGVEAQELVGVCLERSIDLIVTLLAVLKLGQLIFL